MDIILLFIFGLIVGVMSFVIGLLTSQEFDSPLRCILVSTFISLCGFSSLGVSLYLYSTRVPQLYKSKVYTINNVDTAVYMNSPINLNTRFSRDFEEGDIELKYYPETYYLGGLFWSRDELIGLNE